MALIKSTENSESIANPVGCNGWGLEGWERYKNTERNKKRIPGEINIREDYVDHRQEARRAHPGHRLGFENFVSFLRKKGNSCL